VRRCKMEKKEQREGRVLSPRTDWEKLKKKLKKGKRD